MGKEAKEPGVQLVLFCYVLLEVSCISPNFSALNQKLVVSFKVLGIY